MLWQILRDTFLCKWRYVYHLCLRHRVIEDMLNDICVLLEFVLPP